MLNKICLITFFLTLMYHIYPLVLHHGTANSLSHMSANLNASILLPVNVSKY